MCGIAGIISGRAGGASFRQAQAMLQKLAHRGPDGEGTWKNEEESIFLVHRRLSIIDPTPAAHEPLIYGQYVLIFNGEIYNYRELKLELKQKGYNFRSTGDLEVIPAAYDCWGTDCLHRFDGMFAFALLNTQTHTLLIARDRFGEKPLYFFRHPAAKGQAEALFFASEMKALWAGGVPRELNHPMLVNYISPGFVQNPQDKRETFFKDIFNLPPGHLLIVNTGNLDVSLKQWYHPGESIRQRKDMQVMDESRVIDGFRDLLMQSVQLRLRSDVPVGTSLSGGLDSSSIVAAIDGLKKKHGALDGWANVCFSAIFPGFEKDEASLSGKVAENFGISQFPVMPVAKDLADYFGEMMYHQEEPVQSSSVLAQYLVYQRAKKEGISVLLDGQGADEVLAGYSRYSHWYLQQLLRINYGQMQAEKMLLQDNAMLDGWGVSNYLAAFLPRQTARLLKWKTMRQQKQSPLHPDYLAAYQNHPSLKKPEVQNLEDLLFYNTFQFGLEELLRYADRNSMAHSCEVRLPFLSHQLVEFVFSLPSNFKIRQGFGKWILRKAMENRLPDEVVWRKGKVGFEPPQQQWMQDTLVQEMIWESRKKLVGEGIIKPLVLGLSPDDQGAHAANNYDWRYLCSAFLMG